jgi:hypothetical protein
MTTSLVSKAMPSNQILNSSLKRSEDIEKAIRDIPLMKQWYENDDRLHSRFKLLGTIALFRTMPCTATP